MHLKKNSQIDQQKNLTDILERSNEMFEQKIRMFIILTRL